MTSMQWLHLFGVVGFGLIIAFVAHGITDRIIGVLEPYRNRPLSLPTRRALRKSAALLAGAVACLPLELDEQIPPNYRHWITWFLDVAWILAVVLLGIAFWDAVCDAAALRAAERSERAERLLIPMTRKLMRFVIITLGVVLALTQFGVNVGALLTGLGIGGIAVALAAKDSIENLFGSLTILFDMPFALGDWIKVDKVEGVVDEINLRSTKIRTFEDTLITLPNANLTRAAVENYGARRYRRQKFLIKIAHDSNAESIAGFCVSLRSFILDRYGIWPEKTIVELNEIGETYLGVLVQFFLDAPDQLSEAQMRHAVMIEILRLRDELALEAPKQNLASMAAPKAPNS